MYILEQDKVKHILVGAVSPLLFTFFAFLFNINILLGVFIGILIGGFVGIVKEDWDRKHPPHVKDGWDATATLLGSVVMGCAIGISHVYFFLL